eukprot:m.86825 g.86825  ORF g.86825 m.86825 type:complete len:102 (-) comp14482_c0_seq2:353-658(-)
MDADVEWPLPQVSLSQVNAVRGSSKKEGDVKSLIKTLQQVASEEENSHEDHLSSPDSALKWSLVATVAGDTSMTISPICQHQRSFVVLQLHCPWLFIRILF